MNFDLTPEQQLMAESALAIGEHYGLEYWRDLDARKAFPQAFWQAVCDAGLSGVALPEQYGGAGQGMLEMALIVENLSAGGGGATVGQLFMVNPIFGGVSVSKFASEEMKAELLPRLISGDLFFCMALTEPNTGSNSLELKSFAKETDEGWRLNGQKIWITAVDDNGKMLVVARTRKIEEVKRRTEGLSLFVIDVQREGLTHQPIDKVGTNTLPSSTIFFDNVLIQPHELVGTLNNGWYELLEVLNTERIVTTAGLVGASQLAIKLAVEYAADRKVFRDQPIGSYQSMQFPLAQAHAEIESARLMNYKAATLCDNGEPYGSEANVAKLLAAQAAAAATERSMQTMGGIGYSKEAYVERLWRDARLFRFAPVSEEMILNFIAQHDLGMPRSY
ncbi:MAG: acyl-CoA/acyl-ACP dehydrogenase [Gammaproteobacteria bacterium]|nr:acyl-CoA/acyl-ACP dehydrogenase [Gammaproteobacteria bacterium]